MFKSTPNFTFVFFFLILILCGKAQCRLISTADDHLVSDGDHQHDVHEPFNNYLSLNQSLSLSLGAGVCTCNQTYGFLPCTTSVLGNLFFMLVYGCLMFMAATYLSKGGELLLEILGPGLVGGLFVPLVGSLPDAMLILVSGLSGSTSVAQSKVSVGMGLLAGSTVMLLTVIWGSCIIVGKCDIVDSIAREQKDTRGFSLTGSGVTTDIWTSYVARIMVISVIPFIIVQLPQLLHSNSARHLAVLIGLIVSVSLLISYCLYQVFRPSIQQRRLDYVKHKHIMSGILQNLKRHALGRLLNNDGEPNEEVIRKLFETMDENSDGHLSVSELRALIIGIRFEEINLDEDGAVEKVMRDFDTIDHNSQLEVDEFLSGIKRWLDVAKRSGDISTDPGHGTSKFLDDFHVQTKQEHDLLVVGDQSDVQNAKWVTVKAVLMCLLGIAISAAFADPLVDTVNNFSSSTSIPKFFISFIFLPLATNSSDAVFVVIFTAKKKIKTTSLAFSELYASVTMNNVLCLSVFLAVVYVRGLTWDFSSEVLVILIVCIVMGLFGSFRTTFPLWTASVAFLLYPFSLALVYVLNYFFGWS